MFHLKSVRSREPVNPIDVRMRRLTSPLTTGSPPRLQLPRQTKCAALRLLLLALAFIAVPFTMKADVLVAGTTASGWRILHYDSTGKLLGTFVPLRSGGGQSLVFGPDGNLYVVDRAGNAVLRYDGSTGAFIDTFVPPGAGGLNLPSIETFGPDGNLYVSDDGARVIRRYNGKTGAYMGVFTSGASLYYPVGLVFGPDGNLYVADLANVVKFDGATGAFMSIFVPAGSGGLSRPELLVFGSGGNLYVSSSANQNVLLYDGTTGAFIRQFVPNIGLKVGTLAFGPDGNLYIGYVHEYVYTDFVLRYNGQTGALIDTFIPAGDIGIFEGLVFTPGSTVPLEIRPDHGGNVGPVTAQITGSGFQDGATVRLTGLGPDITGTNTTVPYPSALSTTFDLTGATAGIRNVVVTNPDGTSATLTGAFTVEPGGGPNVTISITGRDKIRFGSSQIYYGIIQNSGIVDALNVAAFVDQSGMSQVSAFFGSVPALTSSIVPFTASGPTRGSPTNCSFVKDGVHIIQPNDPCAGFEAAKAVSEAYLNFLYGARLLNLITLDGLIVSHVCFNPLIPSSSTACDTLENIDSAFDSSIKSAEGAEQGLCAMAAAAGCSLNCNNPTDINALKIIGDSLRGTIDQLKQLFLLSPIPQDQVQTLDGQVAVFETQALSLPSSLAFPSQPQPEPPTDLTLDSSSSLQVCGVGSLDPNSKTGLLGVGVPQYIAGSVAVPYSLTFGNAPTATAPAQAATITDPLDTNLDLTTLTLGPITFLSQVITPPSTPLLVSPFSTTVDLRPANNLLVKISASLNTTSGVLTWTFQSLDPTTNQPPTDPLAGFLPPGAEGNVFFTVLPKAGVATGTVIQNQATIVFDVNAPINTPTWSNTLDSTLPASHVLSLPPSESSVNFNVNWTGSDVGSGVQDYIIYVSDNGGPFNAWLTNTTATQATYNGAGGHTYGFYSIARDLTGNVEAGKAGAEATTSVAACASNATSQVTVTRSGYTYNFATGRFSQTVKLTNAGGATISGPISLAFDSLSANATLYNGSGVTGCAAPTGSPYINVSTTGLSSGANVSVVLQFTDPTKAAITYNPRVLAGNGIR